MRSCVVKKETGEVHAKFHQWSQEAWVIGPSLMRGGHQGGQMSTLLGLVEYEDGSCDLVPPAFIRFIEEENHESNC